MSGHSKWAGIKHKKGIADAKRGKLFGKLVREIIVATREGGGNPDMNPRLRLVIAKSNEANMPKDKITQAIKKGAGQDAGTSYESAQYEGYGPRGVAILVEALTDNKNRTSSDVRNIFAKTHGNLAGAGSVAWLFERKGLFVVSAQVTTEDQLMDVVLDAGAEDVQLEGDTLTVITPLTEYDAVRQALAQADISCVSSTLTMVPSNTMHVEGDDAKQVLKLIEALEDHDDVQHVHANCEIPDEVFNAMMEAD
jgi:YebC/PmpR family DNA-binding regulatory protein